MVEFRLSFRFSMKGESISPAWKRIATCGSNVKWNNHQSTLFWISMIMSATSGRENKDLANLAPPSTTRSRTFSCHNFTARWRMSLTSIGLYKTIEDLVEVRHMISLLYLQTGYQTAATYVRSFFRLKNNSEYHCDCGDKTDSMTRVSDHPRGS
jgi:hypothetical protein